MTRTQHGLSTRVLLGALLAATFASPVLAAAAIQPGPTFEWMSRLGYGDNPPHEVVADGLGNIYAAGDIASDSGGFGTTLTKLDAGTGSEQWREEIIRKRQNDRPEFAQWDDTDANLHYFDLTTDQTGHVYVAGTKPYREDATLIGSRSSLPMADAFVKKYAPDGTVIWETSTDAGIMPNSIDPAGNNHGQRGERGHGVAVAMDGQVYLAGYTIGSSEEMTLGAPDAQHPGYVPFVAQFEATGQVNQTTMLSNTPAGHWELANENKAFHKSKNPWGWVNDEPAHAIQAYAFDLIVDDAGNQYLTGMINTQQSPQSFNGGEITTTQVASASEDGGFQTFVTKLDAQGNPQWSHILEANGGVMQALTIEQDGSGNIYIAGHSNGDWNDNGSGTNMDAQITKLTPDGMWQWTQRIEKAGDSGNEGALAVDDAGNLYFTSGGHRDDAFTTLYKYNTDGEIIWEYDLAKWGGTTVFGLDVDDMGGIYLTGSMTDTDILGEVTHDAFVMKFTSVPEPTSLVLLGLGSLALMRRRRRRK